MKKKIDKHGWGTFSIICVIALFLWISNYQQMTRAKSGQVKMAVSEMEVAVEFAKSESSRRRQKGNEGSLKPQSLKRGVPDVNSGNFPPVRADYRKYIGFKRYAECMNRLGGIFILYDPSDGAYKKLDFTRNRLTTITLKELQRGGFSKRTRVIRDEPYLQTFLKGKAEQGCEVLLLIPRSIEVDLIKGLKKYFIDHHLSLKDVLSFEGYYHFSGGHIIFTLNKAVGKNKNIILDFSIEL